MAEVVVFETEEINVASYFKLKGVTMLDYEQVRNKICFKFDDSENVCRKLQVDFLNSECKIYDAHIRDLKKLFRNKS